MLLELGTTFTEVSAWLSAHPDSAYLVLAMGMFLETFFLTSVFVPGELFLLSGPMLASAHILTLPLVCLALYGGALVGDTVSYVAGCMLGDTMAARYPRIAASAGYRRAVSFFEKHGAASVFFARFLGPVGWVMPVLVGAYGLPYRTFLPWNALGILLAVGQFIVLGYLLGFGAHVYVPFIERYMAGIVFLMLSGYGVWSLYRATRASRGRRSR